MGERTFTKEAFTAASKAHTSGDSRRPVTETGERQARETGKLNPLVDPAGFGVIRRSLPRFEQRPDGLWVLTVGTPMPIETRVDTTGSMHRNVDVAFRVLPKAFEFYNKVLPGYDLQVATGIFGDVYSDRFPLCRPQFEMEAGKIVEQMTLMVPEGMGNDEPEDPQYGLFGGAYLTAAYINQIGLKGYDFTISDATAHEGFERDLLISVFGKEVFNKVADNGHQIDQKNLPNNAEVVAYLLKRAHAFFLQVGNDPSVTSFWEGVFGANRVIVLPSTEFAPHVQAVIIGLTEGTLDLRSAFAFLEETKISSHDRNEIMDSIVKDNKIPIGAQASLPNYAKRPKKGDFFARKTDVWPISPDEVEKLSKPGKKPFKGAVWK